ncbi:hypothetical protein BDP27DRAFT_1354845, partial [Rhodocollybia butyracea]
LKSLPSDAVDHVVGGYLAAKRADCVGDIAWLSEEANSSTSNLSLTLHTHTPITSVTPLSPSRSSFESTRWNLHTPRGDVHCAQVLHATNGYASHLLLQYSSGSTGKKGIIPTRGQIIAVRADTPINDSWRASWSGLDHYWFGRPVNGSGADDDNIESKQRNCSMEWVGPVTDIDEPHSSSNIDGSAAVYAGVYTGQYIAAGYSGHGMPRAFSCAEAVASMILSAIRDRPWSAPEWLPERYLTWNRDEDVEKELDV